MAPQIESDGSRARAMWRHCLASAFRTAFACAIVGLITLYGPDAITRQVAYPAFSYVTVILVATDAALGDTLLGCWRALCATGQGVCPTILVLWLMGPERLTAGTTAAVVAASAFVVTLPDSTHLVTKRIALGQIVVVYVMGFVKGGQTEPVMHPIHVAVSTAVGVVACVLALLLPYPNLAFWEVKESCKLYTENASARLKLYVKAFTAEDNASPKALISQAKSLNKPANKFLQCIKSKQESMQWEIIPIKLFMKSYGQTPVENLQKMETILRGMENSTSNISEFPIGLLSPELAKNHVALEDRILNQINSTLQQPDKQMEYKKFLQTLQTDTTISLKNLPSFFFIFCLKLLVQAESSPKQAPNRNSPRRFISIIDKKRLMPALKCSLSLGLAVLFGLIYSKENGLWAGLPVAISLASAREATFKVANVKAQGTVLGTVYGVIGCFVLERYFKIRFVSLIPWFIFSSFLRQSKMYGQAGGVSAAIGAVLILGRKNFGEPSEFAIARIVETFIGLSCSIMVDILLHPTRASVLAKIQLAKSLRCLRETVGSVTMIRSSGKSLGLEERLNNLRHDLNELGKLIEEADVEPNFWFLPFHSACYGKLRVSFSRMVDFLIFGGHAIRFLEKESGKMDSRKWKEAVLKMESDLKVLRDGVCSGIKCFERIVLVKSLAAVEREYEKRNVDLEIGKSGNMCAIQGSGLNDRDDDEMMKRSQISFLEVLDGVGGGIKEEGTNEVSLSLSSLVFCMDGLLRESREVEKGIKDILQWENPSVQVDLHGILWKMNALKRSVACG